MSEPRQVLEEYRLDRVLTMTPASTVFLAASPESGETVALKVLNAAGLPSDSERVPRFIAAMEQLDGLNLAALPEILDLGETPDGSVFLVTRLVEGESVEALAGGPPARVLSLLAQAADALAAISDAGLVHHNLSPDNLIMSSDGRLRLLGLGTAAFFGSSTGALLGHSPAWDQYAAPELLDPEMGAGVPPWRADLYALSLLGCELLGAQVVAPASPGPAVHLPAEARAEVTDPAHLESLLGDALRLDPRARSVAWADLREAVAVEGDPAGGFQLERSPRPAPAPAPADGEDATVVSAGAQPSTPRRRDPNETNPMLIPEELEGIPDSDSDADAETEAAAEPVEVLELEQPVPGETAVAPSGTLPLPEIPAEAQPPRAEAADVVAKAPPPPTPARGPSLVSKIGPLLARVGRRLASLPPRVLVGVAVVALVLTAIWQMLPSGRRSSPPPLPTVIVETPVPQPTAVPAPSVDPVLSEAESMVAQGDLDAVRKVLGRLTSERVDGFTEQEREIYDGLLETLEGVDRNRALENLARGLETGSLDYLHRAVRAFSKLGSEGGADSKVERDLERARQAIRLHTLLWRASRAGDQAQVLERATDLMQVLPAYDASATMRREAAAALEKQAAAAAQAGDYRSALGNLETIREQWPQREGIDDRITRVEAARAEDERLGKLLETARAKGSAGDPEAGLAVLVGVTPTANRKVAFSEARTDLEQQLEAMDAKPPTVTLADGAELAFRKNQDLIVPLIVRDDYKVANVKVMIRTAGSKDFREVKPRHVDGDRWEAKIAPGIHANDDIDLYVVATDRSGHTGRLGSPEKPLEANRKKWYQR